MLTGRTIALRQVAMSDYHALYHLAMSTSVTTWRNLTHTVPPEVFPSYLWDGVHSQHVICRKDDPNVCLGLVSIFNEDTTNQLAYFSLLVDPDAPAGAGGEAAALWLRFVFQTSGLRKVYAETTSLSFPLLVHGSHLPGVREEGRLVDHVLRGGRALDLVVLAVHRDQFLADLDRVHAFLDRADHRDERVEDLRHRRVPDWSLFLDDLRAEYPFLHGPLTALGEVTGGARLVEDLGIDSLQLIEIAAWAEDRYRVTIPDKLLSDVRTLQDAYTAIGG